MCSTVKSKCSRTAQSIATPSCLILPALCKSHNLYAFDRIGCERWTYLHNQCCYWLGGFSRSQVVLLLYLLRKQRAQRCLVELSTKMATDGWDHIRLHFLYSHKNCTAHSRSPNYFSEHWTVCKLICQVLYTWSDRYCDSSICFSRYTWCGWCFYVFRRDKVGPKSTYTFGESLPLRFGHVNPDCGGLWYHCGCAKRSSN